MALWWPIDTAPIAAEQIEVRYPSGLTSVGPWPMAELTKAEQIKMAKLGQWPDFKKWTPTHWRPVGKPEEL